MLTSPEKNYVRIEQAIHYIEAHSYEQPELGRIAEYVGLSPHHFQKLFKQWAGISPKQFLESLTLAKAKEKLAASQTVLETAFDLGLSSPSRLHDLMVSIEAISPGEYKRQAADIDIIYSLEDSPFGSCLMASTSRGLCSLQFGEESLASLQESFPLANYHHQTHYHQALAEQIFRPRPQGNIRLHLKGTKFQIQVWRALLNLPMASLSSYQDLALGMGKPKSTRAVASAIAKNNIGYLIPCHRVISKSGAIHNYRWGSSRKKALIAWEDAVHLPKVEAA